MTPNSNILNKIKSSSIKQIISANDARLKVKGVGNTSIKINNNNIDVNEVLHVPNLATNLLSVHKIVQKGNSVLFDKYGCVIKNKANNIVVACKPKNGVYKISDAENMCLLTQKNNSAMLWHRRLGHVNYQTLLKMKNNNVGGLIFEKSDNDSEITECKVCMEAKQHRVPFKSSKTKSRCVLELIHSDVIGPMETQSIGMSKYILTFVDDFSKKIFCYFLKTKNQVFDKFIEFKNLVENQTEKKIKILRTDNGTEYMSNSFKKFLIENGIRHQLTNAYTPEQNGIAESFNRTLIERAKCLLFDAQLPKKFWAEASNMAAYLINKTISSTTGEIPDEIFYNTKINISNLKIFGSVVMVHVPKEKRKKWDKKSQKLIFVGFDQNTKGYRCMDRKTGKVTLSRDVTFYENPSHQKIITSTDSKEEDNLKYNIINNANVENFDISDSLEIIENNSIDPDYVPVTTLTSDESDEAENDCTKDTDYVPEISIRPLSPVRRETRSSTKNTLPGFLRYGNIAETSTDELALKCDEELVSNDPKSLSEIKHREDADQWFKAMNEEMNSLIENKTWTLTKLPEGKRIVQSKWVFKTKRDNNGRIVRHKARLVAKGYTQEYGIDYGETYAPVVRYTSIRLLIALAVKRGLKIHQMDVITAFLQGDLDEEIYLKLPEGYENNKNQVCKLKKSIYGLKQSSRQWNRKLDETLKRFKLKNCKMDPCIYYDDNFELIVAIYVDDFLIFYKCEEKLKELKASLSENFKMKDMGMAKGCIGMRINQTSNGIELDQSIYINEILKKFKMEDCKPMGTPSDTNSKLSINMVNDESESENLNNIPYQQAVGSLLFLSQGTRPDIAFSVNDVSWFNTNYNIAHWKAVKRIFRYLKNTINYKLCYTFTDKNELRGYSDADWASDLDKRRSCTGYVFNLSNAAIAWKSSRQKTVALSSTEAEYMALSSTIQEAVWLAQLSNELGSPLKPITVYCDNRSTIELSKKDGYKPRTKHIDIRYHYVRDLIKQGLINVEFLSTNKMVADSLTKAVTKEKTEYCANLMGLK